MRVTTTVLIVAMGYFIQRGQREELEEARGGGARVTLREEKEFTDMACGRGQEARKRIGEMSLIFGKAFVVIIKVIEMGQHMQINK